MGFAKDEMSGHGFRAMVRTILDETLHFRPDYIEHQLAHAVRDPNGRAYNRIAHLAERRKMMQAWADYLDALKVDTGTVIAFRKHPVCSRYQTARPGVATPGSAYHQRSKRTIMASNIVSIWIAPAIREDAISIAAVQAAEKLYGESRECGGLYLRDLPFRPALNVLDGLFTRRIELEAIRSSGGLKISYTHVIKRASRQIMGRDFYIWSWLRDRYDDKDRSVSELFGRLGIPAAFAEHEKSERH